MVSMANVGQTDKIIRLVAGIGLLAAVFTKLGGVASTPGILAFVVALILVVTGLFTFCPAYKIFSISSKSG